jgi:hypothetical protein
MTLREIKKLVYGFNGFGKNDNDFTAMMRTITDNGMSLMDGEVEYNGDMTNKHYFFRVVEDKYDENGDWYDGKTVGYLSAYKCFNRGPDNPYEILAYIS